ncbi:MAG TPA: PilZ domain-containing protein [Spirochaetia bacterium]|nr:PilZ domain-containing protein [Spirochaetia bacterium]
MVFVVVLIVIALFAILAFVLLRRAGGGKFPWVQFYLKGRESGFDLGEINLLRRVAVESKLENPTSLFWSMRHLDRSIKGIILQYRSRSQEDDPAYNTLLQKLFDMRGRVELDLPKYKVGIKSTRKLSPNQSLRIMLPGLGPFFSVVVENLNRYLAISYPQGPKLPDGFSWKNQKIGVYFWRAEDAGYYFQTKVLEDFLDRKYPILHILQSENLVRTQKRTSVRVETDLDAELYPMKSIDLASETLEEGRGLRCRLVDISEGGCALIIGGKARVGLPLKLQFSIGENIIVMNGVVKGVNFDEKKGRSTLHVQAVPPSPAMKNRLLTYVYNLFGEREPNDFQRKPDASGREDKSQGVMLKATPQDPDKASAR